MEEEGHQVKSLGDSVYSHHEKRRKFIMKAFIVFCWETAVYWIVGWPWPLICMNRAGGQGKQFFLETQSSALLRRLGSAARLLGLHLTSYEPLIKWFYFLGFHISTSVIWELGLPWGLSGKESACSAGNWGLIPRLGKIPWMRKWQPALVFLPGKSPGQRSLMGYRVLWGLNKLLGENCAQHILNVQ